MAEADVPKPVSQSDLTTFLYSSIGDMQSTIRAIDTKISMILVVIFLPLTKITEILSWFKTGYSTLSPTISIVIALFAVLWFLSFVCSIFGISSQYSPLKFTSVPENGKNVNSYFRANGTVPGFRNIFRFGYPGKVNIDLVELKGLLPASQDALLEVLLVEQTKLAYIRDCKIKHQKRIYLLMFLWVLSGILTSCIIITTISTNQ